MMTQKAVEQLCKGVEIGVKGERLLTKECLAAIIEKPDNIGEGHRIRSDRHGPTSWITITLTEGKFRQVRKMTAAVGFPTLRLIRIRIGNWKLEGMKVGEVLEIDL